MNEAVSQSDEVDRTVRRRLLWLLAPAMLFAFMTRTNVAFVAAALERDFAVGPAVFGLAAGIFFIGYLLFEIPSNLIMAKVGARFWLSRVMIGSGVASALMVFIEGRWSFVGLRFLLGVAEAGFLPGITLYTGYWITSSQLPRFYAVLMSMVPLSYCITAIASGLLLLLDGQLGLAGWQWVFLIEALPAIALGIVLVAKLPDGVADAPWLTDHQKRELSARLSGGPIEKVSASTLVREALANRAIGLLAFGYFCLNLPLGNLVWLGRRFEGSGLPPIEIALLAAAPYLLAFVILNLGSSLIRRHLILIPIAVSGAFGWIICSLLAATPGAILFGSSLATISVFAMLVLFWTPPYQLMSGRSRPVGFALITSAGLLGSFAAPLVTGKLHGSSPIADPGLLLSAAGLLLSGFLIAIARRRARRIELMA